jgi:hypothetical protein
MHRILSVLATCLLCALSGCEGMKLGTGYRFDTREFFLTLEQPLESGLKK